VFFEKFLSPDELRSEAEAKRKLDAELDARYTVSSSFNAF